MKLLRQSLIILCISLAGEVINRMIGMPIPGNVIGMIILFICLVTGVIKLEMIEEISKFFLDHLAFFFVPAAVGILANLDLIKANILAFTIIIIVSTIIVTAVTGHTVQIIKRSIDK